ncbi:MAG TPA: hypothetical protein DEP69_06940, partial [Acidimicrobiaceae bacterium]|nr:hypothetical protein [Acidimicrobiaceae bacterium]
ADVVKVEPPDGDPYRADPGFQALNRNKRSVVAPDGSGLRERLLGHADAVVVPDAAAAHAARSKAPDAVVVSFPVWGTGSPAAAGPSSPGAVAAATGIGWNQLSYGEGPVHVVLPLAGYGAGMLGALAVAAGLYARQTTGRAPTYEVSDVAGAGAMQIGDVAAPDLDAARDAARDGSSPLGSAGRAPAYRLFEAADRRWLFVACGTTAFYESMLAAVGRRDLLDDPRLPSPPWGLLDAEPLAFITPVLEAAFAGRTRAEWLDVLAEHDVPCQPVQTRAEFTASSTAAANGLDVYVEHRELGTVAVPPQPLRLSECPAVEPTA